MKFNDRYITLVAIVFSLIIAYIFFGQNLDAQMGVIDDHSYIDRGVINNFSQVVHNFVKAPEIQNFGNSNRFRIVYRLINDIEAATFGMNAYYYYLINICVFAFFIFTIFYVAWKNIGFKWAIPFTMFILIPPYFAHIFTRLGTAEIWAMFGLSIYTLGYASLFQKIQSKEVEMSEWKEWMVMLIGSIVAIGSKENFAILFVMVISMLIFMKYYSNLSKIAWYFSIIILFFNVYQMAYVFTMQINKGVDLYQNNLGVSYRLMQIVKGFFENYSLFFTVTSIVFLFVFSVLFFYLRKNKKLDKKIFDKIFFNYFIFYIIINSIFYFNLYVYDGKFNVDGRYAFPAVLMFQLLILLVVKWFFIIKKIYFSQFQFKYVNVLYGLLLVSLLYMATITIPYSWTMSQKNVEATIMFQDKLDEIIQNIEKVQKRKIVFYSYNYGDYEALQSVAKYLKYNDVKNDLMIKTNYSLNNDKSALIKHLENENLLLEDEGGLGFVPYYKDKSKNCIAINFSTDNYTSNYCDDSYKIWRFGNYPYSFEGSTFNYFVVNSNNDFVKGIYKKLK